MTNGLITGERTGPMAVGTEGAADLFDGQPGQSIRPAQACAGPGRPSSPDDA
jgi:hypothetical protein